jgi:hypothetical protein
MHLGIASTGKGDLILFLADVVFKGVKMSVLQLIDRTSADERM